MWPFPQVLRNIENPSFQHWEFLTSTPLLQKPKSPQSGNTATMSGLRFLDLIKPFLPLLPEGNFSTCWPRAANVTDPVVQSQLQRPPKRPSIRSSWSVNYSILPRFGLRPEADLLSFAVDGPYPSDIPCYEPNTTLWDSLQRYV